MKNSYLQDPKQRRQDAAWLREARKRQRNRIPRELKIEARIAHLIGSFDQGDRAITEAQKFTGLTYTETMELMLPTRMWR